MKKILYIILFILSLLLLLFLLLYSPGKRNVKVKSIEPVVVSSKGESFVSPKDLERELVAHGLDLIGKSIDSINTLEVERKIRTNNLFSKVNVFTTPSGVLKVEVEQVEPLFVVFPLADQDVSYYVTYSRAIVPFSGAQKYAIPLLPVSGNLTSEMATSSVFDLVNQIKQDPYWSSFFIHLFMDDELGVIASPRIGDTMIILGHEPLWSEKLGKLRVFIKNVIPKYGWSNFISVNLEYKDQIVVVPRGKLRERFPLPERYEEVEE